MAQPLRIGMIGLDTSHVVAFTQLLNDPANPHHVPGGKVVVAWPGSPARDFDLSCNRVEGFTKELKEKWGVRIVDSGPAAAEACDLLFIESVDGRVHLEQFRQTVRLRKPTFIDKPLAVCSAHAREIFALAREHGTPVMSSSSLRYAEPLVNALKKPAAEAGGAIVGVDACGPMGIQPTQPGLYWYGIHIVEVILAAMGPGCRRVTAVKNDDFDLVTCEWKDGRLATIRGQRKGHGKFGALLHREQGFEMLDLYTGRPGYAGLLEAIMTSLPQGRSAVPAEESVEIIRLIEAANESRETGQAVMM